MAWGKLSLTPRALGWHTIQHQNLSLYPSIIPHDELKASEVMAGVRTAEHRSSGSHLPQGSRL